MKKRTLYALLFGVPGFFLAGITALAVFGASMGVLWIFVFGDDPWPGYTDTILTVLLVSTFLLLWLGTILLGYRTGRRLEHDPGLNRNHILLSGAVTLLFILFIVFQQWSVGNLGPRSDSLLCSDYCVGQGYAGSGMPPRDSGDRTCSCYDSSGNEVLKVPLDRMDPGELK